MEGKKIIDYVLSKKRAVALEEIVGQLGRAPTDEEMDFIEHDKRVEYDIPRQMFDIRWRLC